MCVTTLPDALLFNLVFSFENLFCTLLCGAAINRSQAGVIHEIWKEGAVPFFHASKFNHVCPVNSVYLRHGIYVKGVFKIDHMS